MPNWKKVAVSGSNINFNQVSASAAYTISSGSIDSTLNFQANTNIDIGVETVATIDGSLYKAGFFDYLAISGSVGNYDLRAGSITIIHDGTVSQLAEYSTQDIGNTNTIKFSSSLAGNTLSLLAAVSTNDWSVKTVVRSI